MGAAVHTQHAAILFADVKGYSVLISRDEVGTYERLRRARALFRALVGDYGGRIVDEAGDGVLAAFADAAEAVDFALAMQRDLANAAAWHGESGPFAFRMGIHVGRIHQDGERLFGKTLIIAQRIQEVAPPGRVCVSNAVREAIVARTDLHCVNMGTRWLKNLDAVGLYRVEALGEEISLEPLPMATHPNGGAVDEASLVVLPFESQSTEIGDTLLCDGITTDVIERVSRFRELCVIARHSAFQCRSLLGSPAEVGEVLGARYVALGAIRREAKRLRVTAQLLEAESGRLLWSDRYDGVLGDVFDFQDEVAGMIASRLATQINAAERRRILSSRAPDVAAYSLVLRGQDLTLHYRQNSNSHARRLFEEAASLDPAFARVYVGMSRTYSESWRHGWDDQSSSDLDQAMRYALRAIDYDNLDARGYAELGYVQLFQKQHQQSLSAYTRASQLNPNDADVLAEMSDVLSSIGEPDKAIELMTRAMRLNPYHPDWYLCNYADALFVRGDYPEVISVLMKMHDLTPGYRLLAACHALLGDRKTAGRHANALRKAYPNFSLGHWKNVPPDPESPWMDKYFEGLRLAGLD